MGAHGDAEEGPRKPDRRDPARNSPEESQTLEAPAPPAVTHSAPPAFEARLGQTREERSA
jgi:hypothetical protein